MSSFQVLFSGEIVDGTNQDVVRGNLARELGIDERKARQLFSGRTVVIRSQLAEGDARAFQARLSELGAVVRVKDLTPREKEPEYDRDKRSNDFTLKDITAAHVECPRCGFMQLETQYCGRCGVDIALAAKQKLKEDKIIEKKIRALRAKREEAGLVEETIPRPHDPLITLPEDQPASRRFSLGRLFKKH